MAKSWEAGRGRRAVGGRESWRVCANLSCVERAVLCVEVCLTQGLGSGVNM